MRHGNEKFDDSPDSNNDLALKDLKRKLRVDGQSGDTLASALDSLSESITLLDDQLYALMQQLQPVLRNPDNFGISMNAQDDQPDIAPAVQQVREECDRIDATRRRVCDLASRLAL